LAEEKGREKSVLVPLRPPKITHDGEDGSFCLLGYIDVEARQNFTDVCKEWTASILWVE
jgi:hypothetical protein